MEGAVNTLVKAITALISPMLWSLARGLDAGPALGVAFDNLTAGQGAAWAVVTVLGGAAAGVISKPGPGGLSRQLDNLRHVAVDAVFRADIPAWC